MKCDLCGGEYKEKRISQSYNRFSKTVVVENIPALVCDRCGDILLSEETVEAIQDALKKEPQGSVPLYRLVS